MPPDPNAPFNHDTDCIAITMPRFKMLRRSDGIFQRRHEPYVVSVAIDQATGTSNPAIDFNALPFPNVLVGDEVKMLGHGHLFYGPKHPGDWIALSILFMESDRDIRGIGKKVGDIVGSKAADMAIKAVLAAQPTWGTVVGVLKELTNLVAQELKANRDDELFRTEGVFLKDYHVPFSINRSYERSNSYIETEVRVLPLAESNKQGSQVERLAL